MRQPLPTPPVLFVIFNRAKVTELSFATIRKARPTQLFIAGDASRSGKEGEAEQVRQTRQIVSRVDWPCDVKTCFHKENQGCGKAVSGAISWFFQHVEEGIILEDDCVADQSFFGFAGSLLDRFRNNDRVLSIRGDNYQQGRSFGDGDYYFSKYPTCWGWATWKRKWELFDLDLSDWPESKSQLMLNECCDLQIERDHWSGLFDRTRSGEINSWLLGWVFASFKNRGLHASPNYNMIQNIGFGEHATHTTGASPSWLPGCTSSPSILRHPKTIEYSASADRYEFFLTQLNKDTSVRQSWASAFQSTGCFVKGALRRIVGIS